MKTDKSKKSAWPAVSTVKRAGEQVSFEIAIMIHGKRIRERFKTEAAAQERAEQIRNQYQEEGKAAFSLSPSLRMEALKCSVILEPHGVTITDAVNHYVKTVLAYRTAPTINKIVERMIAEAEQNGRRDKTTVDLSYRLGAFCKTNGEKKLSEITIEELKQWIDDPTLGARSRINNATKISQLYNFAIRAGWAEINLVKRLTRPSVEDVAPGILTPLQAGQLLQHADKYQLLPYIAIGLFAGLRSAELHRLDWQAVKLAERCIIVGSEVAKKRSRRVVEINDTLAVWLAGCGKLSGKVVPIYNLTRSMKQLAKAARFASWPHNALRHSFASYHLAKHGDPVKTAFQMGNSPVMVHNHYKGLVTNGDVERFWNLRPAGAAADKITPMVKPAPDAEPTTTTSKHAANA